MMAVLRHAADNCRRAFGLISIIALALAALAGCASDAEPAPPTYALSAPTLAPSEVFFPIAPDTARTMTQAAGMNDPTAASVPSGQELPPVAVGTPDLASARQTVMITAGDGTRMMGAAYVPPGDEPVFPVMLLAQTAGEWGDFPLRLQAQGLGVLVLEARSNAPVGDLSAAFDAISLLERVDVSRIAYIGTTESASLALAGCGGSVPCDAMALISPLQSNEAAVLNYGTRPLFLSAAEGDAEAVAAINAIRAVARGQVEQVMVPGSDRGAALILNHPQVAERLITWLQMVLYGG